ncbi:MAG: DUF4347 domain-containing protein [Desulfomonile tiedjei]|nr:DUF4347 domain-containing protein [Desulfomonile tiedjei]
MARQRNRLLWRNWLRVVHPGILCEQMEDRIVLDAAAAPAHDTQTQNSNPVGSELVAVPDGSVSQQLAGQTGGASHVTDPLSQIFAKDLNVILVSNALDQIKGITDAAKDGTTILSFDPIQDNLATINSMLDNVVQATGEKISTLAIFAHAGEGLFTLGTDNFTFSNLNAFASGLAYLQGDLAANAQIQLYGCSLAGNADGRILVNTIATFTGADVFVSKDLTGGAAQNWTLEYSSNPNATMSPLVDTVKLADAGITLSAPYPEVPNNWAKSIPGVAMFFASEDVENGTELWRSDGTAAGTFMLKDISVGKSGSNPSEMTLFDGKLYFRADDGANGTELWVTDGTAPGTHMVADINPGRADSDPSGFTVVDGFLYFSATDGVSVDSHGTELWRTDGSVTERVTDINPDNQSSNPTFLTEVNGTLFFAATDGINGNELWNSDGTATGTRMVVNIRPGSLGSDPSYLTNVNGTLFFAATDGDHGEELWKSTLVDTTWVAEMVKDINPEVRSSSPGFLIDVNGTLFFAASDGSYGNELWKSDGTDTGTKMVADVNEGIQSSNPSYLVNVNDVVYFAANDGIHSNELWKSDGTDAGTKLVLDIDPGHVGSDPQYLNAYEGALLFSADDGSHGYQLWRSDGSEPGTKLLKQINLRDSSFPLNFAILNPLFFLANDGSGFKLWKTDGTAEGTVRVDTVKPVDAGGGKAPDGNQAALAGILSQLGDSGQAAASAGQGGFKPPSSAEGGPTLSGTGAYAGDTKSSAPGDEAGYSLSNFGRGGTSTSGHAEDQPDGASQQGVSEGHEVAESTSGSPVPVMVKVMAMDNGDFSVRTDSLNLVVSHELWIPPMVKWYLAAVSEGRYRPGSLPRGYERMIWDYLQYWSSRQGEDQSVVKDLETRLAWQWADWRRQVVKDRGNAEGLPWTYFRGLCDAMTVFYGESHGGKVDYSNAVNALHHNVRNLTIIPVQLPDEVTTRSDQETMTR